MKGWKFLNLNNLSARRAFLRDWHKDNRESMRQWVQWRHEGNHPGRSDKEYTMSKLLKKMNEERVINPEIRGTCRKLASSEWKHGIQRLSSCDRNSREKLQMCNFNVLSGNLTLSLITWKDNLNEKLCSLCQYVGMPEKYTLIQWAKVCLWQGQQKTLVKGCIRTWCR